MMKVIGPIGRSQFPFQDKQVLPKGKKENVSKQFNCIRQTEE
jgi:hypothetical protein